MDLFKWPHAWDSAILQWFSIWGYFASREHLATSRDFIGCINWEQRGGMGRAADI